MTTTTATTTTASPSIWRWLAAAAPPLAIGLWALLDDVEGLNTGWFVFSWTAYLIVLDGLLHALGGRSWWLHRRRELGALLWWSVPFWFVFEVYNLVLLNWYYVAAPRDERLQALFAGVAFATVLPACFFHADVVSRTRVGRWQCRPRRAPRGLVAALWVVGVVFLVVPVLLPRQTFWMIWGALLVVPDLINRRLGAQSLLRDLEEGRLDRVASLLIGGLCAGGAWESLNFFARTKWLYTVPGFEHVKLFEMPVLGFVGFPLLALEAFASYTLLCVVLRGGRSYARDDVDQPRVPLRHRRRLLAAVVVSSVAMTALPLERSLFSVRAVLEEVPGVDVVIAERLRGCGIGTPEALARDGVVCAGIDDAVLARAHDGAALVVHKGLGADEAHLLTAAGIDSIADLAQQDPAPLTSTLQRLAHDRGVAAPPAALVRLQVAAARR